MENLEKGLKDAGLTGNEAKVYLELSRNVEISVNDLSKKIGMDRTLVYTLLNNLSKKGLVSYIIKNHKKYFKTSNEENLLNSIKEKEAIVKNTISEIKKIEKIQKPDQEINVYEGKEGIKVLVNEVLKEKNFGSFGGTGRLYDTMGLQMKPLLKQLKKTGAKGRIIMSNKSRHHPMTKLDFCEFRFLDSVESPATTSIFGDKVSIHLLTSDPIVIIIKNKEIAEGYKNYFEFLWKAAKDS